MKDQFIAAAASIESHPGRLDDNLDRIGEACRHAANLGAELLLLPELSLTGFIPNHPRFAHADWLAEALAGAWRMALPLQGLAVKRLIELAGRSGLLVAAGFLETTGNTLYNTHVLVGDGKIYGAWRKMHIPMFETPFYNGGGAAEVVETPLGRIGVNICFDAFLPESTRLLALQNAEIALFPFAADPAPVNADGWWEWAGPVVQARCAENALYGVAANYFGELNYAGVQQTFGGGAAIVGPHGRVVQGPEDRITATLLRHEELLDARAAFEYTLRFRRPELYDLLTK